MAISMYSASVPQFKKMLGNLAAILKKAEEHGTAKKIDGKVFLDARLFPNMFFYFQSPRLTTSCAITGWRLARAIIWSNFIYAALVGNKFATKISMRLVHSSSADKNR